MSEIDAKTKLENDDCVVPKQESAAALTKGSGNQTSTPVKEHGNEENVTAVVKKAKRAATFLWTLLHAQVRV